MSKKPALGKGLDALLSDNSPELSEEPAVTAEGTIINLNPSLLKPNPYQPRKTFDEETIEELASSIKEHGIIQPIVAEQTENGSYFIISGERRTRAATSLGLKTVPVILRSFADNKKLEVALIENIQREDLNALEEALAYQEIMNISNINHEELARRVGKSRSAITNSLRILKLPEEMQEAVRLNKISAGHARSLLSVVNPADQQVLFGRIIESNLSVRETEAMAANFNSGVGRIAKKDKKEKTSSGEDNFELRDIEQQFINSLGTKVQIKGTLKKGTVEISYFSKDDLDSLYQKLKNG
ncbi:ParB/RepB/Spo0J family partition protein [Treponema pedis]|uniref:ParB/RepB/Spo0J family partition protein n=1 Tax=Treponema pedis TaxID=409322 RepID=A0A7S7AWZ2_9SPIR|nr:ParB/RepB/Spo0J family partition protein [Treponema pedis]QOW61071.1 ParB/RepB/Spo0J family partition protein [Treponema pedis]QSI04328.1 ParB/RepB/Spo0J family partition protein [Treponema pedis]